MSYQHLLITRDGPVVRVTINRPAVRNAFNDVLVSELTDWAVATHADATVRAVVVAGAGPTFCAGADLQWMARTVEYTDAQNIEDATATARMFWLLDTLPVPVIGRVQGAALGGGAGLAAVCDVVVSDAQAVFGFTEVKLGIVPAVISPFVLAKIGRSAARELFLTGRRFSAQHAQDIGLVHTVVPPDDLDVGVEAVLREVRTAAPGAVAVAKRLIADLPTLAPEDARRETARALAERRTSAEGQEGLRAFLERRKPSWSGA